MQRRSTTIFLIGLLTLVLGMAVTYAALHHPTRAAAEVSSHGTAGAVAAPDPNAVTIPEGKQALAVALDPVAGTAGVAHVGSHIDVFAATAKDNAPNGINAARMVIQNVEVLRVDNGGAATLNPKDVSHVPSGSTVFVLAVNQTQAEKIVFHAAFSKLWFSVVPDGQKPVGPTPGVDLHNQLNPEAA